MTQKPNIDDFSKEEIISTLKEVRFPVEVAVYHTSNGFNFGSIVRTCHNFLVKKIWAIDIDMWYEKAALGTQKYENIEHVSLEQFVAKNKDKNIVCFERRIDLDTQDLRKFCYPQNPILVLGNEKLGVPSEILNLTKNVISIPQYGIHNDFNVAVAAGIILYDWNTKFTIKKE